MRSTNKDMSILLIVDLSLSPATYIIPSIMAASLLIRPFDRAAVKNVLDTVLKDYCEYFEQEDGGKVLWLKPVRANNLCRIRGLFILNHGIKRFFSALITKNTHFTVRLIILKKRSMTGS